MTLRRALLLLMLVLGLGAPALAAAPATPAPVPGKISITGDSFVVDQNQHQATFSGNVVVTQSQLTLTADKVVAFYGAAGGSSIQSFEATGHVKISSKQQSATGDKAVYDPETHILTLTGKTVVVSTASGEVQSTELVVDLKRNTSVFSNTQHGGRVTGVFTSQ